MLNQIGVLHIPLNQMKVMYGQRIRHFEFIFQHLENQFGSLDKEFVNQTDNAQTIAKIYDMQERQNAQWTQFESDLKVAFVRFYEKMQNEILTRVTKVQSLSNPSHLLNPAFDAKSIDICQMPSQLAFTQMQNHFAFAQMPSQLEFAKMPKKNWHLPKCKVDWHLQKCQNH